MQCENQIRLFPQQIEKAEIPQHGKEQIKAGLSRLGNQRI